MTPQHGDWLRALSARVCAPQILERIIDPLLADFHTEMRAAAGRPWTRGYLRLVNGAAFVKVIVLCGCHRHTSSDETSALGRTASASLVAVIAAQTLFMLPPFLHWPAAHWPAILYVVPQAVPLSLPIGLTAGILYGLRPSTVSRRARRTVAVAATICSIVSFATMAWVVPLGNQAFRERVYIQLRGANPSMFRAPKPQSGLNELTIGELRQELRAAFANERSRRVAMSYYQRWTIPCATITLALFAMSVVSRWRLRRFVVVVIAGSTLWAYTFSCSPARNSPSAARCRR
jgi:hypothetical protein